MHFSQASDTCSPVALTHPYVGGIDVRLMRLFLVRSVGIELARATKVYLSRSSVIA